MMTPEVIKLKLIEKLANERFARPAAGFMEFFCYLAIALFALCTILSFMGRQTFFLHTHKGTFEHAIYAEENHAPHSRYMTVSMDGDTHVWTNNDDQIDLSILFGLSLMYAVSTVPMIFAFWFLRCVFSNILEGQIFIDQNSRYLLYYGLLQLSVSVFVPFIKLLICWITNQVSDSRIAISTGQSMFNTLIPSIAFIVAAYIIHYGVSLQDEVDHTL